MSFAKIEGVKILGISACVPSQEIDNAIFGKDLYGDSINTLVKTTGVRKRRVCKEGTITALDLSVRSAEKLFACCDCDKTRIGGIVFVTQTPDNLIPNNATYCQHLLDLPSHMAAFDINIACSGYSYGLFVAGCFAKSLNKNILLLDGDTHSHFISQKDKVTSLLFGDAGSATIVSPSEEADTWYFDFETLGSERESLIIPEGGYRNRVNPKSSEYIHYPDGGIRRPIDMKMDGMEVFNFVARNVPKRIQSLMDDAEITPDCVDWLILHQANQFMLKQVARSLQIPWDKVPISLDKYGNSGSPTIPVTICSELSESLGKKEPSTVILCGFGAGLSIGAACMKMKNVVSTGVIEYE